MVVKKEKRLKKEIVVFLIIIVLVLLAFLTEKTDDSKIAINRTEDKLKEIFGWTTKQFIEWAQEVQPIKEHKRWKIWKDGRRLMEPNEPFHASILNDPNDVLWIYPRYSYEWLFELPKELPEPVIRVLSSITFSDVNDVLGKNIREIISYVPESFIVICALENEKIINSEVIEIKLSFLGGDKLSFSLETEPFILSDNSDVCGLLGGKVVLYVPKGCKVNVCQNRKDGNYEN